ncbi:MAG TPA: ketoacyl-ACP synthase III [Candidatus Limnocylindria bacterium]|nr:ketoacyl-ACP synthase III [Candidatus Limnocylindria bacterium]
MQQTAVLPTPARTSSSSLRIAAMGTYLPEKRLTNDDLSRLVETNDEWIVRRTGIRERRVAREDEFTSDLCLAAVRDLERRGGKLDAVDYVIACTVTPDYGFPSVAARLQDALGLRNVGAIDIVAACAGFVYGLDLADALITTGRARNVLIAAGETLTKVTDYRDRATCVLFGDGAGVALVSAAQDAAGTVLARYANSDGAAGKELYLTGLRSEIAGTQTPEHFMRQNGRAVYEWAVTHVSAGIGHLLASANLRPDQIDWFVPHSANLRMIESICKRSGIPLEKTLTSMELCGNTSSASIPLALAPALADGRVRSGDLVLLYGFGGGLVENALLLRWS